MSGISISKQSVQEQHTRIELLNSNDIVVEKIEGITISGNISIDSTSNIRRTCNLELVLNKDNLVPRDKDSKIWYDKRFRLYVGVKNFATDEIEWFNKGVYYFKNPVINLGKDNATISIEGIDKIYTYTKEGNGHLQYTTKINAGTPVFEAVKNLIGLNGETRFIINDVENLTIPYEITKNQTATILDFLEEIKDLYMGYEFFYNEEGVFIWQKIRDRKNDNVQYVYDEEDGSIVSYSNTPDWNNVYNNIIVWGMQPKTGSQIKATISNKNNNKFGSDYIKEKTFVVSENTIQTKEQADLRAEYELYLHSNLNEKVVLNSIQILDLDVNKIITINKDGIGVNGNYVIERLSYNLGLDGTMNLEARKLYY